MKLSTRSRYGTRIMLEMARHYKEGFIQSAEIAKHQDVSLKYIEQILIPLKKANYVKSARGPRGGHRLAKSPGKIKLGNLVALLEGSPCLTECTLDPKTCGRVKTCMTRKLWQTAARAMYAKLNTYTLYDLVKNRRRA